MKVLLLDIETSPNIAYTWGLYNQNIAINQIVEPGHTLCWAAKWLGSNEIMFRSLYHNGKITMLDKIWNLLNEADAVIHYNGASFDIPKLMQAFVELGCKPPSPIAQIDLMLTIKKRFAFQSNKLEFVVKELGIGTKVDTGGMDLWRACMNNERTAWEKMKEYNIHDTVLLEPLYERLKSWIIGHPNASLYLDGNSEHVCPNCGGSSLQSRGLYHAKTQSYNRYCCNDCGKWSRTRTSVLNMDKRKSVLVGVE